MSIIVCRPKSLQLDLLAHAERKALIINPANETERHTIERTPVGRRGGPRRIAVVIGCPGVRLDRGVLTPWTPIRQSGK